MPASLKCECRRNATCPSLGGCSQSLKACVDVRCSSATKGLVGARGRQHQRQCAVLGSLSGEDSEARRDATWAERVEGGGGWDSRSATAQMHACIERLSSKRLEAASASAGSSTNP